VVVRLNVNKEGTSLLTVRVAKGQSWCESDKLAKDTVKTIPKKKTEWFLQRVQKLDYWRLPSRPPRTGGIGVDGAQWVIEASKDGAYKIVDRWSPDKGPVRALGLIMLFDMAKLRLQDRDVY
jgi:hypothetical protein